MKTREQLVAEIEADREAWHALLAEVGEDRMEEPGPMGEWTFKDLAAHLAAWREWGIMRIEAGPDGEVTPPWPASLGAEEDIEDWDEINAWFYEQHRYRPLHDVLADVERLYDRLANVIATMPEDDLMTPGRYKWMGGKALIEAELLGHLHEEHMPGIRAWLETRDA